MRPSRVLIGSKPTPSGHRAAAALADVYAAWVPRSRIVTTNVWSSELAKLVANAMLAQRISSINSISAICEKTGADIDEIAKSVGLDPRIGSKYLKATFGFGGSCFKKDVLSLIYLAESLNLQEVGDYWSQVLQINDFQHTRFVKKVIKTLNNSLINKKLTILGYAFKRDTADTRDSLVPSVIKALLEEAPKEIALYDPCCEPEAMNREIAHFLGRDSSDAELFGLNGAIHIYTEPYVACSDSSAIMVLTDWDELKTESESTAIPAQSKASKFNKEDSVMTVTEKQFALPTKDEPAALAPSTSPSSSSPPSHNSDEFLYDAPSPCDSDCLDCSAAATDAATYVQGRDHVDWAKISYHMQTPKWVFDGKGIFGKESKGKLEKVGLRLVQIGKV